MLSSSSTTHLALYTKHGPEPLALQAALALTHTPQRPRTPPGLPLGALALPWCYAALLATGEEGRASAAVASHRFALAATCSAACLAPLLLPHSIAPSAVLSAALAALSCWCLSTTLFHFLALVGAALATSGAHVALLRALPDTLTAGEALLACHAAMLAAMTVGEQPETMDGVDAVALALLLVPLAAATATGPAVRRRQYGAAGAVCAGVFLAGYSVIAHALRSHGDPFAWALDFLLAATRRRVALLLLWIASLTVPLNALLAAASRKRMPRIVLRKAFHVLALLAVAPAAALDPELLRIGLAAGGGALIVAEAARIGRMGRIGAAIGRIFAPFADDRDAGALVLSPFSLLLGMAAPVWMAPQIRAGSEPLRLPLCAWAGILALGVGDAAAAGVGAAYGRTKLFVGWSKTWKGTTAGGLATLAAVFATLSLGSATAQDRPDGGWRSNAMMVRIVGATGVATALEAVTAQNDNAFVPLAFFALLRVAGA